MGHEKGIVGQVLSLAQNIIGGPHEHGKHHGPPIAPPGLAKKEDGKDNPDAKEAQGAQGAQGSSQPTVVIINNGGTVNVNGSGAAKGTSDTTSLSPLATKITSPPPALSFDSNTTNNSASNTNMSNNIRPLGMVQR
jgi:hypothetical protein